MKQTDKTFTELTLPPLSVSEVNDLLIYFADRAMTKATPKTR